MSRNKVRHFRKSLKFSSVKYAHSVVLQFTYTVKNFSRILHRQTRDIKLPSLDGVKLRMECTLETFRKFLSLIVKLHLVVNFTNCYCIIPNLVVIIRSAEQKFRLWIINTINGWNFPSTSWTFFIYTVKNDLGKIMEL